MNIAALRPRAALLLTVAATPLAAETGDVTAVELFFNRALVTRQINLDLTPAESTEFALAGLPNSLDPESLQVEAPAGVRVLGAEIALMDLADVPKTEALLDAEAARDSVAEELSKTEFERETSQASAKHARALADSLQEALKGDSPGAALLQLAVDAGTNAAKAEAEHHTRTLQLDHRIKELREDLTEAEKRVRELAQQRERQRNRVTLYLAGSGQQRVELRYVVNQAGWRPLYRIDASPDTASVAVAYRAEVYNRTGEDWKGVRARLSTGSPDARAAAPELPPVYLAQRKEVYPATAYRGAAESSRAMTMITDLEQAQAKTEVAETTLGFTAELPVALTLPSGDEPAQVSVLEESMPANFLSATTPQLIEEAFLSATIANGFPFPLLAGQAQLLVDGKLTARTRLDYTLPGEEIEVGLGPNPRIEVERKTLVRKTAKSGIFDRIGKEERIYLTRVSNNLSKPHTVRLTDRFPVSRDEKIEVAIESPKEAKVDEETGRFTVERRLEPGETWEVTTSYQVTFPAKWELDNDF